MKVIYETVQNPVAPAGGDPWVIRHGDKYYYCYSSPVWFFGGVGVAEIPSVDKVSTEGGSQVYVAPAEEGADLSTPSTTGHPSSIISEGSGISTWPATTATTRTTVCTS